MDEEDRLLLFVLDELFFVRDLLEERDFRCSCLFFVESLPDSSTSRPRRDDGVEERLEVLLDLFFDAAPPWAPRGEFFALFVLLMALSLMCMPFFFSWSNLASRDWMRLLSNSSLTLITSITLFLYVAKIFFKKWK